MVCKIMYCIGEQGDRIEIQHKVSCTDTSRKRPIDHISVRTQIACPQNDLLQHIMTEYPFVLLFIPAETVFKGALHCLSEIMGQIEYTHIFCGLYISRCTVNIVYLPIKTLPVIRHIPYPIHLVNIDPVTQITGNGNKQQHYWIQISEYSSKRCKCKNIAKHDLHIAQHIIYDLLCSCKCFLCSIIYVSVLHILIIGVKAFSHKLHLNMPCKCFFTDPTVISVYSVRQLCKHPFAHNQSDNYYAYIKPVILIHHKVNNIFIKKHSCNTTAPVKEKACKYRKHSQLVGFPRF